MRPAPGRAIDLGDVVEIDPEAPSRFRLSSAANSSLVAGVVSTHPGMTLNAAGADEGVDISGPALALAGRVPVKVSAENGAIAPGDLLVSASIPGHAMRASPQARTGTVVGKALERFATGTGVIEMLVMLR